MLPPLRPDHVKPETDRLLTRIAFWVGIAGFAVTFVLELLGVFHDVGILLSIAFGGLTVVAAIKGATRAGVEDATRKVRKDIAALRETTQSGFVDLKQTTQAGFAEVQRSLADLNEKHDRTNYLLERMVAALGRIEERLGRPGS